MQKCFFILILLLPCISNAQSKFFIQIQTSPKITVNNNSGVSVDGWFLGPNNGPDSRSALSFGLDNSIAVGYRLNSKNLFTIGSGIYTINQIFRPFNGAAFRLNTYRNIHTHYRFLVIPLSYEYQLYAKKKWNFHIGIHLSFVGDVFQQKNKQEYGLLRFKNGDTDPNGSWYYFRNYLNMHTFNFLYGFSFKTEYKVSTKLTSFAAAQFMQGFRPLITSGVTFAYNNSALSHSIATTNGQSLMINLGVRYNF